METIIRRELYIEHDREGSYLTLPFAMPPDTESLTIRYAYERTLAEDSQQGEMEMTSRREVNIIDLGLIAPDGTPVGESGADKMQITVSATGSTPGYRNCELVPGEWQILVGAYYIAPEGVNVSYEITCKIKSPRWLRGDLHTHTLASDGILTPTEIGWIAVRHGLDFVAITDHNHVNTADSLPHIPGLTFIQGQEWTHYRGHANFLGVDKPYDLPFATNTVEDALARFGLARSRGAFISINHPFEPWMGFEFDLARFPYDCLEVWNGPMREPNLRALGWWQAMLAAGKKAAICGGSDFHRNSPFQMLGGPTNCVYAMSAAPLDILAALRAGHSYIIYAPDGPRLQFTAGVAMMGDAVDWTQTKEMQIAIEGLLGGDVVCVVTGRNSETILQGAAVNGLKCAYKMCEPGFARIEVLRSFAPGLPMLPALLSNPIYFEG